MHSAFIQFCGLFDVQKQLAQNQDMEVLMWGQDRANRTPCKPVKGTIAAQRF